VLQAGHSSIPLSESLSSFSFWLETLLADFLLAVPYHVDSRASEGENLDFRCKSFDNDREPHLCLGIRQYDLLYRPMIPGHISLPPPGAVTPHLLPSLCHRLGMSSVRLRGTYV
jgi:hypothetical protein